MERLNDLRSVFERNPIKVMGVVLVLLGFWGNSRWITIGDFKEHKTEVAEESKEFRDKAYEIFAAFELLSQEYEIETTNHELKAATIENRLGKKIDIIDQLIKDIDKNENDIIRLQEQIKK